MLSEVAKRVALLLTMVWNGNQREMAKALGLSPTVIHKVINGQQEPGRKFLAALAAQPKVSPTWVLTGEGQPLVEGTPITSSGAGSLPIVERLLPGPPSKHQAQLVGREQWVATVLMTSTRYWFRVRHDDPITRDPATKVAGGDGLVIETDTFWTDDPASIDGRIVAVNVAEAGPPDVRLGLATYVRATDASSGVAVSLAVPGFGDLMAAWPKKPGNSRMRGLDFAKPPDFSYSDSPRPVAADRRSPDAKQVAEEAETGGAAASVSARPAASDSHQLAQAAEREATEQEAVATSSTSALRGSECICGAVLLLNRTF